MPINDDPKSTMTARERGALVVSVAAVTVAVGVTLASLAGWRAPHADVAAPSAAVAPETLGASTQRVVLVPVSPATEPTATEGRRATDTDGGEAREHRGHGDEDGERHERRRHREHDDDDGWLALAEDGDSRD